MKCDECGKESRTGALEALFERCDVCGKSLCLLCQGALADNHGATHLCPTHYKQVKECINILKGEKYTPEKSKEPNHRCPECGVYGVVVDVKVRGFRCIECGEVYPSESNRRFVPEKPLYAGCYVRREPFLLEEHIVVETRWGDELFDEPVARAALISDALFAYMEKERGR